MSSKSDKDPNPDDEEPPEELWLGYFPKKYRSLCIIGVLDFVCGALLQDHKDGFFLKVCFTMRVALASIALWGNVHENTSIITFTPFIYFLYLYCFVFYFTSTIFSDDFFEITVLAASLSSYFSSVALFYSIVWLQIDFELARADVTWKAEMEAKGRLNALAKEKERIKEKKKQQLWTNVSKLSVYFIERWNYLLLTAVGIVGCQVCEVCNTMLNAEILQSAVDKNASRVWYLMKLRILSTVVLCLAHSVQAYYQRMVREYVEYDMRKISVKQALAQEIGYYDDVGSSSEVFSTAWHKVGRITCELGWHIRCMFEFSVRTVTIVMCMFRTDIRFSILLTTMSPILMVTTQYFNEHCGRLSRLLRDSWEELDRRISEAIHNIRTVKVFGGEPAELKYVNTLLTETYNSLWHEIVYCESRWACGRILQNTANIFLYYYSVQLLISGEVNLSTVFMFCGFEGHMSWMMNSLSNFMSRMQRLLISSYKVFKLMEREPRLVFDKPGKKPVCSGKLEFKNVTMAYPTAIDKITVDNLSLTINPGEMVAFVGESGCGKSTVLSMMNFSYGYNSGEILLDGVALHEWNKDYFYENVVTVPQDSILFARTIEENIKFGLEASRDEVIVAAKKANCHDFIEEMERGYLSVVGERGTNLSGGQKQRISIARALLRKPKILLLDEATSSLDTKSERCVQSALHDVMKNNNRAMSIVVIAHRLSTIRKADRIVVFDKQARIIELGKHESLMKLGGHYAELVMQQKLTDSDEESEAEGEEKGRCAPSAGASAADAKAQTKDLKDIKAGDVALPQTLPEKKEEDQPPAKEDTPSETIPPLDAPAMLPRVTG